MPCACSPARSTSRTNLGSRDAMGFLTAEQVAEFLKQNPGFFESHVEVLMNLQIPHPHGGRAVSIGERQLVAARAKAKRLEEKRRESISFGQENDAGSQKGHRLRCRLLDAP